MAILEVGDQSWTGRLPSEQVTRDLCRSGAVHSPEATEKADVFSGLFRGHGDGGDVETLGEGLGALTDRHPVFADGVQNRPSRC